MTETVTVETPPTPITVPTSAAPALANEAIRTVLLGLLAIAADRFVKHDSLLPAILAGAGFLATWAAGAVAHIETVGIFKCIDDLLPNNIVKSKSLK